MNKAYSIVACLVSLFREINVWIGVVQYIEKNIDIVKISAYYIELLHQ